MRNLLPIFALTFAGSAVALAESPSFIGTWATTYGQMALVENNGILSGNYGGKNSLTGTVRGDKFAFNYFEPGVTGEGEFILSPDGQSFSGKWRPAGRADWSTWTGKRMREVNSPKPTGPGSAPGEGPDEPRPVVYRFGNLPPGLPGYFTTGDTDKDGQVGLYEWVQFRGMEEAALVEFKALDLNRDGLLTAEEYLRAKKAALVAQSVRSGAETRK